MYIHIYIHICIYIYFPKKKSLHLCADTRSVHRKTDLHLCTAVQYIYIYIYIYIYFPKKTKPALMRSTPQFERHKCVSTTSWIARVGSLFFWGQHTNEKVYCITSPRAIIKASIIK